MIVIPFPKNFTRYLAELAAGMTKEWCHYECSKESGYETPNAG
jgi:hypothetical protein